MHGLKKLRYIFAKFLDIPVDMPRIHARQLHRCNFQPTIQRTTTLTVIEEKLAGDQSLNCRTNILVPHLVELVELCLRSSYLQFQDSIYEQTDGAAMSSPLSPIVVNLYLKHLEEEAIQSAPPKPKLWRRYMDDTFVIWPHRQDELHHFYQHLNSQHPSIQFTMEEEKDHKIAFLNVLVLRNGDRLATSTYRKPTHTDRYIPFNSNHHPKTITGVMRGMHVPRPPRE